MPFFSYAQALVQPGRVLVAGVDVDGAKTPSFTSSHERCRKAGSLRNYNVLLFADVVVCLLRLPSVLIHVQSARKATMRRSSGNFYPTV